MALTLRPSRATSIATDLNFSQRRPVQIGEASVRYWAPQPEAPHAKHRLASAYDLTQTPHLRCLLVLLFSGPHWLTLRSGATDHPERPRSAGFLRPVRIRASMLAARTTSQIDHDRMSGYRHIRRMIREGSKTAYTSTLPISGSFKSCRAVRP